MGGPLGRANRFEGLYIKPPELVSVEGPVIFLNGPIQGAPMWQPEAANLIHARRFVVVASPRHELDRGAVDYEDQVDWETHFRRRAAKLGAHLFWLARQAEETPGRSYAQTTRGELFESKMLHERDGVKLAIGIESGFGNERYIRRRFSQDCPEVPILDNLEATVEATLELVSEL